MTDPNMSDVFVCLFFSDVNECDVQSPCQHLCYNLIGSFLCQCNQGYELAPDAVSCQGEHTHIRARTHIDADWQTFVHVCFFSMQTLTNAASRAICASTSAWTLPAVTPASVQRDISSRETGFVKVLYPSFCYSSNMIASLSPSLPSSSLNSLKTINPMITTFITKPVSSALAWQHKQKLSFEGRVCEFMCMMVFSEVDFYEARGLAQRVSCYLFSSPTLLSQVQAL